MSRGIKTRTKGRSCTGKRRFESKGAAKKALNELLRDQRFVTRMNVYACTFCDGFHIGHKRFGVR